MKNGFLHNLILSSVEKEFLSQSWKVKREYYAKGMGWIDLLAEREGWRVAVEVELTPRRIQSDIEKAIRVQADHLLIATTCVCLEKAIKREVGQPGGLPVFVFPVCRLRWLREWAGNKAEK